MASTRRPGVEAGEVGLDAVEAPAGGDVEGLAGGAAELDVRGDLGGGEEADGDAGGVVDVDAGELAAAGGGDDQAVGGEGQAVDAAAVAEVLQDAGLAGDVPFGGEGDGQEDAAG